MIIYIYEGDWAIGYMDGDRPVYFLNPVHASCTEG